MTLLAGSCSRIRGYVEATRWRPELLALALIRMDWTPFGYSPNRSNDVRQAKNRLSICNQCVLSIQSGLGSSSLTWVMGVARPTHLVTRKMTDRNGQNWGEDELQLLRDEVARGMSPKELSQRLGRTQGAVENRVYSMGLASRMRSDRGQSKARRRARADAFLN